MNYFADDRSTVAPLVGHGVSSLTVTPANGANFLCRVPPPARPTSPGVIDKRRGLFEEKFTTPQGRSYPRDYEIARETMADLKRGLFPILIGILIGMAVAHATYTGMHNSNESRLEVKQ